MHRWDITPPTPPIPPAGGPTTSPLAPTTDKNFCHGHVRFDKLRPEQKRRESGRRAAEHAVSAPPQDNVASEADVSEKEEKREGVHDPENTLSRDKSFFRIQFSQTPPSPLSRFLA